MAIVKPFHEHVDSGDHYFGIEMKISNTEVKDRKLKIIEVN